MRDLKKLESALKDLEGLLKLTKGKEELDAVQSAALSKLFEVAFEYSWKALKDVVNESGLEAYSPRDVIKAAGQAQIISSVEVWLDFLESRNLSVHDYVSVEEAGFRKSIGEFVIEARSLLGRLRKS